MNIDTSQSLDWAQNPIVLSGKRIFFRVPSDYFVRFVFENINLLSIGACNFAISLAPLFPIGSFLISKAYNFDKLSRDRLAESPRQQLLNIISLTAHLVLLRATKKSSVRCESQNLKNFMLIWKFFNSDII